MEESEPVPGYRPLQDSSLYGILMGNALTLGAAVTQHWSAMPILWIYWGQSVVIGVANVIRMVRLREFSTTGYNINDRPAEPTRAVQMQTAWFFAFHYGAFHLFYALFLATRGVGARLTWGEAPWVVLNIATFAFAHGYSLLLNHGRDFRLKKPNIGALMFYPYLRVLPMQLAIIAGINAGPGIGAGAGVFPLFIGLKTFADAGMHMIERWMFQRAD